MPNKVGRLLVALVVSGVLLLPDLAAYQEVKVRGTVRDSVSRKPIPRVTVTASGNQSKQDEVTDDQGFFRLVLEGVSPGALVRIRAQKDGYAVYDRQIAVSEEIPIEILMTAAPAHGPRTTAALSPVEAHFIEQLKSGDRAARLRAIESLGKQPILSGAATAAITAAVLDADLSVQTRAVRAVKELKLHSADAVQNLIIALNDSHEGEGGTWLRASAANALGEIGANAKSAIPALLNALNDPFIMTETEATIALLRLRVQDPRLDAAVIKRMEDGSVETANALVELGPWVERYVPGLIGLLRAKVQDDNGDHGNQSHLNIIRVLEADRTPGDAALGRLMAELTPAGQARLALDWVEMQPAATSTIRREMKIAEVTSILSRQLDSDAYGDLAILEKLVSRNTHGGVSLRAAIGVLLLNLQPQELAWRVVMAKLETKDADADSRHVAYAAYYVSQLDPAMARRAVPAMVEVLQQITEARVLDVLVNAIVRVGDDSTIPLLDRVALEGKTESSRAAAARARERIRGRIKARLIGAIQRARPLSAPPSPVRESRVSSTTA